MKLIKSGSLKGNFTACPLLRDLVMDVALEVGISQKGIIELEMAVGEICINIVEHTYKGLTDPPEIAYFFWKEDDFLRIIISDHSLVRFDITEATIITPEEFFKRGLERGLGIYVINHFVDSIECLFTDQDGNTVTLTKKLIS